MALKVFHWLSTQFSETLPSTAVRHGAPLHQVSPTPRGRLMLLPAGSTGREVRLALIERDKQNASPIIFQARFFLGCFFPDEHIYIYIYIFHGYLMRSISRVRLISFNLRITVHHQTTWLHTGHVTHADRVPGPHMEPIWAIIE